MSPTPALVIENLTVRLPGLPHPAVADLSINLGPGEILGVVGESGSGKSMTAFAALRLEPAGAIVSAKRLEVAGLDVLRADGKAHRTLRGGGAAMIFQEPMTALSPTRRVGDQMADLLIAHQGLSRADALTHAAGLLERVQIRNPRQVLRDYPFQLSGGMRQRVLIAMAFAGRPRLVIADEITTAIDATVGRAVLDLLADWARDIDAAILFISHDLALVGRFCQRVVVMQAGRIVEEGPADRVIQSPQHPYTRLLRAALPELGKPGHPLLASIEPLS